MKLAVDDNICDDVIGWVAVQYHWILDESVL